MCYRLTFCSYICSKDVANYDHFGDPNKGRCALHDNVEEVHEQAVKKAADEAMAQVRAENPDLSDADLMIQVSDRVKQVEAARKGRAAAVLNELPQHMVRDQHARGHNFPEGYVPPFPEFEEFDGFDDFDDPNLPFPFALDLALEDRLARDALGIDRLYERDPEPEVEFPQHFHRSQHLHHPFVAPPAPEVDVPRRFHRPHRLHHPFVAPPIPDHHYHQYHYRRRDIDWGDFHWAEFDPEPELLYGRRGRDPDDAYRRMFREHAARDYLVHPQHDYQQHYHHHYHHRRTRNDPNFY